MHGQYDLLLSKLLAACRQHYGARLVSVAVLGSVGRGTPHPDSDLDLLIVADGLPDGRLARARDFQAVETALGPSLAEAHAAGLDPDLSPAFKTPAEVELGSLLFLDLIDDARLLDDRENFLRDMLASFQERLWRFGARRIWRGNAWILDLKPDYTIGEVFEL